ncbi:MAG: Zn-ribbon domain-containing OB-fold protein [Pseudomonadota bacterium]|nr:Zn-ribbon domain-containing OB-fold protein [Pseudomonadota bacterium]
MSEATATAGPLPVVPYLKLPEGGSPYLEGTKCGNCGAVYVGPRRACSSCFSRDQFETIRLQNTGKLYTYTIVYRSFPGVETPFVSAVVDLDGGGTIKGNLINVDPNPESIPFDMPVRVVFKDAGRKDAEGNSYTAYFFEPAE